MEKLSAVAKTLTPSPIQELSFLAQRRNAINLAEGFPDFPAPSSIKDAAVSAINSDFNQYRHVQGICDLLARKMKEMHGLDVDPQTDIAICCGQTEAFASAIFASTLIAFSSYFLLKAIESLIFHARYCAESIFVKLLYVSTAIDPGDEVILFDPSFETYEGCITLAGGVPVFVALDPPHWSLDPQKLINSCTSKTKAIVVNSPQNPTGKVFTRAELEIIAKVCCTSDFLAITDEVYEHLTFDEEKHISLASLPGMQKRTIITSSLSKTYSVTGWRIGWAIAASHFASAIRNFHIRITDSAPAPFQEAALTALRSPSEYYETLRADYKWKRDYMLELLDGLGFQIEYKPQGSFFVFVELPQSCKLSDVEFVKELIEKAGVVAVPGRGFFHAKLPSEKLHRAGLDYHERYIRFAFCKSNATLATAWQKLNELVDSTGHLRLFN
ncbi:Aminotransferase, class I/classII [Dillenia turbinata]|uniref:Aminotransferase, class I/classII n=1 Tax=Dillenia turbinata TaxID=194707 RepID=A0AAN8VX10_9MAGN